MVMAQLLGLKLQQLERFVGMILSCYQQLIFGQDVADRLVLIRLEYKLLVMSITVAAVSAAVGSSWMSCGIKL